MRRNGPVILHQKNRRSGAAKAAAATRWKEKSERYPNGAMIGEGTHSTNQRRHTYVRDNVEVGFFTDPTVCIGCKACEVACKEWNHVPDDGFVWSGNSYDNTGHLGASTWRHVMFVEQDRQKGGQIVGSHSLVGGDEDRSLIFLGCLQQCKHGCLAFPPGDCSHRSRLGARAE
jgi:hypothetical protein